MCLHCLYYPSSHDQAVMKQKVQIQKLRGTAFYVGSLCQTTFKIPLSVVYVFIIVRLDNNNISNVPGIVLA